MTTSKEINISILFLLALSVSCLCRGCLGANSVDSQDESSEYMQRGREEKEVGVESVSIAADELCNECRASVALLMALVRNGTEYDQMKDLLIQICKDFVVPDDYNQDQLCELALDTYAPHVIYIFNTTENNANYLCSFYYFCPGITDYLNVGKVYSRIERDRFARSPDDLEVKGHKSGFIQPIRVLHVTDIHVDSKYAVGSPTDCDMPLCCRTEYSGNGTAKYWGDYPCNIPYRTAERIFLYIIEKIGPDLIINTGDTVQHTIWDQPLDETIATDAWLTQRLYHYFPGIPAYLAVGNHDMSPTNLYYAPQSFTRDLNEAMYDHWKGLSKFTLDSQKESFEQGLYYTASPFRGLRILSYNSEYGALDNFYNVLNFDEPEYPRMLQFMEDTMSAARANNEKVILIGHHPTGGQGVAGYGEFINDLNVRYGDDIILHLFGHNHDDMFSLVRDKETGETKGVQLSAPSMTSYTDTNPSFRVFYLDPVTYKPLDVETYHINLQLDGANMASPPIRLTWRASDDYGMADATPKSFEDLINRSVIPNSRLEADPDFLALFRRNVDTQTGFEGNCDERCKVNLFCHLRNSDNAGRSDCRNNMPR